MKPIALAMGGLLAAHACAQDDSWDRIRQRVLAHPAMEHQRRSLEERKEEWSRAGRLPVPRLELELEDFAGSGEAAGLEGSRLGIWVGSDYRLGDVRGRERELAAGEVSLQALDTLRARRELVRVVRDGWERWRRDRWMAELTDSLAAQADTLARRLEEARTAGRVGSWEVSTARSETAKWRLRAEGHRRMAQVSWSAVSAWTGGVPEPGFLSGPELDTSDIVAGRGEESMLLEAERVRTRGQAAMLAALDRPVVSGALGMVREQVSGDVALGARLSLPMPPWDRPGLETVRTRNQAVALERRIHLLEGERAIRRAALHGEWMAALSELRSWESEVIPSKEQALRQVEAARVAGAVDASVVWAVRKELWDARIERLERLLRALERRREREIFEGVEP